LRSGVLVWAVWIASCAALSAVMLAKYHLVRLIGAYWVGWIPASPVDIVEKFIPAFLLIANLISFDAVSANFGDLLGRAKPAVRFLANRSFSIYLFQAPVFFFMGALTGGIHPRRLGFLLVVGGCLVVCLMLAEFTEKRRPVLARWLRSAPQWGRQVIGRPTASP
jgi:peptidoglycan/LPS O-acetylase OafA/YrhL